MNPTDVRAELRRLFERLPRVPVALDLASGERVFVDTPKQLGLMPTGLRLKRHNPVREDRAIEYAAIRAVTAMDELPAEPGGMTYRDFYAAVRPLFWAEPFVPYELELRSGERIQIDGPLLTLAGRFGHYSSPGFQTVVEFTVDQVVGVRPLTPVGN